MLHSSVLIQAKHTGQDVKRIMQYLKATKNYGLLYHKCSVSDIMMLTGAKELSGSQHLHENNLPSLSLFGSCNKFLLYI